MHVIMYSKENCTLCDQARIIVELLQDEVAFRFKEIDIYQDDNLLERYHLEIPVIKIGEIELTFQEIDYDKLKNLINK